MVNLQPLLGMDKANPFFEVLVNPSTPNELLVHFGACLLEKVHKGGIDVKFLAARLYNAGFSRKRLTEALGFDKKTMRRWGRALREGDAEAIARAFSGQGAERRMIPMLEKYVRATYRDVVEGMGCRSVEFIRGELRDKFGEEFCHDTIRRIVRDEDARMAAAGSAPASDAGVKAEAALLISSEASEPPPRSFQISAPPATVDEALSILASATGGVAAPRPGSDRDDDRGSHQNSLLSPPGKRDDSPRFERFPERSSDAIFPSVKGADGKPLFLHHVGLTLCRVLMDSVTSGLGEERDIVRQWVAMILCGCCNIENGRSLNYRALEILLGEQVWSSDRQRERLHSIAGEEVAMKLMGSCVRSAAPSSMIRMAWSTPDSSRRSSDGWEARIGSARRTIRISYTTLKGIRSSSGSTTITATCASASRPTWRGSERSSAGIRPEGWRSSWTAPYTTWTTLSTSSGITRLTSSHGRRTIAAGSGTLWTRTASGRSKST